MVGCFSDGPASSDAPLVIPEQPIELFWTAKKKPIKWEKLQSFNDFADLHPLHLEESSQVKIFESKLK